MLTICVTVTHLYISEPCVSRQLPCQVHAGDADPLHGHLRAVGHVVRRHPTERRRRPAASRVEPVRPVPHQRGPLLRRDPFRLRQAHVLLPHLAQFRTIAGECDHCIVVRPVRRNGDLRGVYGS